MFCNPPYGRAIKEWVKKCHDEAQKPNTLVVMLIPARTDTSYKHVTMEDGQEGKMCSKCMEVKPLSEFGVANSHWDKLTTQCKTCTQQYGRDRYKRICLKRWEAKEQPKTAADGDNGSGKTTACGK